MKTFDTYEIRPVLESWTGCDDTMICEPFDTLADAPYEADENDADMKRIFWTLYGRIDSESQAISEFESEEDCLDLLAKITGIQGKPGAIVHPTKPVEDRPAPLACIHCQQGKVLERIDAYVYYPVLSIAATEHETWTEYDIQTDTRDAARIHTEFDDRDLVCDFCDREGRAQDFLPSATLAP